MDVSNYYLFYTPNAEVNTLFSEDLDFIKNLLYQSLSYLFVTLTLLLQVDFK